MKVSVLCLVVVLAVSAGLRELDAAPLPVVTLSYDGSLGSSETDEGDLEDSSWRHQVTLRVRERWSKDASATLEGILARKLYVDPTTGYPYLQVGAEPTVRLAPTDGLRLVLGLGVRRSIYDRDTEPDATLKSYSRLRAATELTIDLTDGLSLIPRAQATIDLYDDATKTRQSYTFGVGMEAKLGQLQLGADYRGVARAPLGGLSLVENRVDHSFGVDLSWDPND